MPAFRARFSFFALTLLCVCLSGCDRHNESSVPDDLPTTPEPVCDYTTDFPEDEPYVNDVKINNTFEDQRFSIPYSFDPDQEVYGIFTSHLVNSVRIAIDEVVASEYSDELASLVISINGNEVKPEDAFVEIPLSAGDNTTVELVVLAQLVDVLRTKDEEGCGYPPQSEIDDAIARDLPSPIPTRIRSDLLEYTFNIYRQPKDVMVTSAQVLNSASIESLSAHDNFGSQVLMGEIITNRQDGEKRDVMVIGVPLEDSNFRGVVKAGELNSQAQDNSATDSGAVFIYERDVTGAWALMHYIKAAFADAGDRFGSALALHDNMLVVSALGEDSAASGINGPQDNNGAQDNNLAPESGALYVFEYDDLGSWRQSAFIKTPVNAVGIDGFNDGFGSALSFESGLLLVSAPKEDSLDGKGSDVTLPNSGAVYLYSIFEGDGDFRSFNLVQAFKARNANRDDYFGSSVDMSISGERFVVGSTGEDGNYRDVVDLRADGGDQSEANRILSDNSVVDSGAVYTFHLRDRSWFDHAYIKSANSDVGDYFGASVRFMSDDTLLIGAPLEDSDSDGFNRDLPDNSAPNSGAVYLYTLLEDEMLEFDSFIKAPVSEADEHFGSVLTSYEGSFVVSAPNTKVEAPSAEEASDTFTGQVYGYLFDRRKAFNERLAHYLTLSVSWDESVPVQVQPADVSLVSANERYGRSLSLFGATLAVGAPGLTVEASGLNLDQAGGVFVYQ